MFTQLHMTRRLLITLAAVLSLCLAAPAFAQQGDDAGAPLADRLPAEAILYVGWVGSEGIAQRWEGTHTQALIQQSNFEDFFTRYLPEALDKLAQEEPEAAQAVELARELLPLFVQRPSAFAFGGVNFNAGGAPVPKLIFAIDAGEQANALEQRLRGLMREAGQQPMAMFLGNKNGIVRFAMGYDLDELDRLATGEGASSLAASEGFRATMGALNGSPTSAFYVDFARLLAMGEQAAQMFAPPEELDKIKRAIDATGLRGLGQLGLTSGFSGKMYETQAFLSVTGREGFLSLLPDGPLDDQTLAAIPAGSTMVIADQFDFAAFLDVLRQIIVQVEPEAEAHIAQALAMVNDAAGVDVEADVLRQFGTTWGYYVTPKIGNGVLSGVMVNRPRDPAKLDEALVSTCRNILAMANGHISQATEGTVTLPGRTVEMDGQTLHILNTPLIAPTWSVDRESGLLQIGFYPQSLMSARTVRGEAFVKSPAWQAMQKQLAGDREISSLTYYDLPSFVSDSYPLILMFSQAGFGAADLFSERLGTRPPTIVLPPLASVLEHVEPSGSVSWVTEDGIHFRAIEPFPMSGVLATDMQSMALNSFFSSIGSAIPAMQKAREAADQAQRAAEEARQAAEEARREPDRPE